MVGGEIYLEITSLQTVNAMNQTTELVERAVSKSKEAIIKEAQRIEESALLSSKGHFRAATMWGQFHIGLGLPTVVLAALAGASAFAQFDKENTVAGVLSIVIVVLSSISTFLNPNKKASVHLNAGNKYDALRDKVRIFRTIECWEESSEKNLSELLMRHSEDKSNLNQTSPQIPQIAYRLAKSGIKKGEADYEADKPSAA